MPSHELLVVGSANADLVTVVDRHPQPGETVLGSNLTIHPGGKGANQAVAAAQLGARTGLLARIGDDEHGRLLHETQRAAGVDTAHVRVGGGPTGATMIAVDGAGNNTIVVSPGANHRLTPHDVRVSREALAAAGAVSLQLEIPPETVAETARVAAAAGVRVVLNASPPAPLPDDVLAVCDPLVVNEHEARYLLGERAPEEPERPERPDARAEALRALGPRSVVVTLGAAGALALEEGADPYRVSSPAVSAVDTTGAGDAFTGALAWRLSRGEDLATALRFAVRVGAAAVTRAGAQSSFPAPEELPPQVA